MGWANKHIEKLQAGETVTFRPHGNSMTPKINSGDLCTVAPVSEVQEGDIVLCKVKGRQFLHLVTATKTEGENEKYQISNNHGHVNGWISKSAIFGKLTKVES